MAAVIKRFSFDANNTRRTYESFRSRYFCDDLLIREPHCQCHLSSSANLKLSSNQISESESMNGLIRA